MTTEHELRAYITNLRTHLMSEVGAKDWKSILTTVAQLRGYFDALIIVGVLGRLDVNEGVIKKACGYLEKIQKAAVRREQRECNTNFLLMNELLVEKLDIPPIIDQ